MLKIHLYIESSSLICVFSVDPSSVCLLRKGIWEKATDLVTSAKKIWTSKEPTSKPLPNSKPEAAAPSALARSRSWSPKTRSPAPGTPYPRLAERHASNSGRAPTPLPGPTPFPRKQSPTSAPPVTPSPVPVEATMHDPPKPAEPVAASGSSTDSLSPGSTESPGTAATAVAQPSPAQTKMERGPSRERTREAPAVAALVTREASSEPNPEARKLPVPAAGFARTMFGIYNTTDIYSVYL